MYFVLNDERSSETVIIVTHNLHVYLLDYVIKKGFYIVFKLNNATCVINIK